MSERELEIVRVALSYLLSNHEDASVVFCSPEDDDSCWESNGKAIDAITEDEIRALMQAVQG